MSNVAFATVQLARFDEPRVLEDVSARCPTDNLAFWTVGFDHRVAGLSLFDQKSSVWAAIGLHHDEDSARALLESVDGSGESVFHGATERWSALLQPFAHRGEVNWLEPGLPGLIFTDGPDGTDGAPLVVITTVGWDFGPGFDMNRAVDFDAGVDRVYAALREADGLCFRHVIQFPLADRLDGMTLTCWRDDRSMRAAAYRPGPHKTEMDRYRQLRTADRTSFTRFRVLDARGAWQGNDLVAEGLSSRSTSQRTPSVERPGG